MIFVEWSEPDDDLLNSIIGHAISKLYSAIISLLEIMSDFEKFFLVAASGEKLSFQQELDSVTEQEIARAEALEIFKLSSGGDVRLGIARESNGQ
jgi:hypothetical protein